MNFSATLTTPFSSETFYTGSIENAENSILALVSHLCGMEIDHELFKHTLPETICDAACITLTGETASGTPGTRCFNCRIVCRGSSGNSQVFSKVHRLLSYAGEPLFMTITIADAPEPATFESILPQDEWKKSFLPFGGVTVPLEEWDLQFRIVCAG